jgi:flagellar basal body rod protein FlgB
MKLQNHLHYTDFKNKSLQQKKDAEEKTNGNNVGSQEQKIQLTSNENMISYCQLTMQSLMECYEIVGGLKK